MNPFDMLEPARLEQAAAQLAGTDDFGTDDWREALTRLVTSMREDGTPAARVGKIAQLLVAPLSKRAEVVAAHAADPALAQRQIPRPIFITGFPRTGTTLMHNLLAQHPEHLAHPLWKLQRPAAPPEIDEAWRDARRAETTAVLQMLSALAPNFAAIHPMGVERPDECNWLLRNTFASLVYALQYPVPSYMRWLMREAEVRPAYAFHKLQLQLLDARATGGRLVCKDPFHLWHLDALLEVWPDATIIQMHRHPCEALPSLASLCLALHAIDNPELDPHQVGRYALELAERGLEVMEGGRAKLSKAQIIDVRYRDFVADPSATVKELVRRLGGAWNPGVEHRVEDWMAAHPKGKGGHHRYSLDQFGLDEAALVDRFGAYIEAYGLEPSRA